MNPELIRSLLRFTLPHLLSDRPRPAPERTGLPHPLLAKNQPAAATQPETGTGRTEGRQVPSQPEAVATAFQQEKRPTEGSAPIRAVTSETVFPLPGLPDVCIIYSSSDLRVQERENAQRPVDALPSLTVQWGQNRLVFRATRPEFRRMVLEWNGPVGHEGRSFRELLVRLKEYGIEEVYRNGRRIGLEERA